MLQRAPRPATAVALTTIAVLGLPGLAAAQPTDPATPRTAEAAQTAQAAEDKAATRCQADVSIMVLPVNILSPDSSIC
ncbi:hypothetical protein SUDANB106_05668 [Streptomyces sp. enrichment culture]|uniref:hypothetical protein n=1 Tax=Streptomyces sp. enrichment culture TaxID=1795815 RepID=UPI003F5725C9